MVDVRYLSQDEASTGFTTPSNATGLSQQDVEFGISRAIEIWNEEAGSSLRLRFQGQTATSALANTIVITGRITNGGALVCNSAIGLASVARTPPLGRFHDARIEVRRFSTGINGCSIPIGWCTTGVTSTCTDYIGVLVHELGHAAFNLQHPDSTDADCSYMNPYQTVMFSTHLYYRDRTLKQYDMEMAQARYGPRSSSSSFMNATDSGIAWTSSVVPGQASTWPLYRPGSLPNLTAAAFLGWLRGRTTAQPGGTGFLDDASYVSPTLSNWYEFGGWSSGLGLARPVAMAGGVSRGVTNLTMVYERSVTGILYNSTDDGNICYRQSTNGGVNWMAEVCTGVSTGYFGLTATYDRFSDSILVGYVANDNMQIGVVAIPAPGNVTTPIAATIFTASSWHAPSIACAGVAGGCKVAFESATNIGQLSWLNISVSHATGLAVVDSSYMSGWVTFDTPSIAYNPGDGTFLLAYTANSEAIYTYKMTGNSLVGSGDAFNNTNAYVSSPAVNVVARLSAYTPSAWFLKYW
jgi:hypothetical protein